MLIRDGRADDADSLCALAIQVWLDTYASAGISAAMAAYVLSAFSSARFAAWTAQADSAVFVAEVDRHLIGFARASSGNTCPVAEAEAAGVELCTLYVQAPFVRRGAGRLLLARTERWAQERGSCVWLTVNARNASAIAFYAKHGYTERGTTPFRLGGTDHDNLVLAGARQGEAVEAVEAVEEGEAVDGVDGG